MKTAVGMFSARKALAYQYGINEINLELRLTVSRSK
jgi:hypothetical protein